MTKFNTTAGKPPIIVSDEDYGRLTKLATAASDRFPDVAEELQIETERAQVLSTATIPEGVVQMGSTVEYHSDVEHRRRITLVYPGRVRHRGGSGFDPDAYRRGPDRALCWAVHPVGGSRWS